MKKRNLKSLSLNKKSISHFNSHQLKGGLPSTVWFTLSYYLCDITVPDEEPVDTTDPDGSLSGPSGSNRHC